ncbi:MAG TPA: MtnX-like HAD-IB family phosphatase [Planctomycetaceae bacterium]
MTESDRDPPRRVLVSDFDGTMTRRDYYEIVMERLLPPDAPDFFGEYRDGRRTLFEALRDIFAYVPAGEETFARLTRESGLDPDLARGIAALRDAGWEVVVVSAGCRWYIDRLLAGAGVAVEVFANPGRIDSEGRLIMEWPTDSPYQSANTGTGKAAAVRALLATGRTVAYAGDSIPDLEAALLVPPDLRFARAQLARSLAERGERFRPFDRWIEVAETLARQRR